LLPFDVGDTTRCKLNYLQYYYDNATGLCGTFNFSGCYGNSNRFPSEQICFYYCREGYHHFAGGKSEDERVLQYDNFEDWNSTYYPIICVQKTLHINYVLIVICKFIMYNSQSVKIDKTITKTITVYYEHLLYIGLRISLNRYKNCGFRLSQNILFSYSSSY